MTTSPSEQGFVCMTNAESERSFPTRPHFRHEEEDLCRDTASCSH